MNSKIAAIIALIVVIGGGAYWYVTQQPPESVSVAQAANGEVSADADTSMVQEMSLGNPDAKVTVVEYASFTCPHCRNFHSNVFDQLKANYIDTGKIHFIYREVYFDRYGLWAGMIARCGGEMRYFGITDMIYDMQQEWTNSSDPTQIAANLRQLGIASGLSGEQVDACMADVAKAEAMVAVYNQNRQRDDVTSTPTFRINGEKYGNMSYSDFADILEEKLAE
ncbi:MAG: DsbA family protein [Paracoccaceae bacterium]|nr:DsbA family protein [Paracoccaceae bacterium]